MYGHVADMPSSGTFRSHPPKTGSQYPMRSRLSATASLRKKKVDQVHMRLEADDARGVRDEIRERVDVVEIELSIPVVDDVFHAADVDAHGLDDLLDRRSDVRRRVVAVDPQPRLRRLDDAGIVER